MSGRHWFELRDALQLLVLLASDVAARFEERRWPDFAHSIGWWADRTNPRRRGISLAKIAGFFPEGVPTGVTAEQLLEHIGARLIEETILMRRLARRPDWRPKLTLLGAKEVDAAAREAGVLLWVAPQPASMILVAVIGHDRGWPMQRLSIWSHGVSGTRFASAALNPLWRRVENRYAQRIVIEPQRRDQAKAQVIDALGAGGVLQIQAVDIGRRLNVFPLLGGHIRLALGAPKLAERAGVPLFGVTVRREADSGYYFLEFEKHRAAQELAGPEEVGKRFVAQLAGAMQRDPASWKIYHPQTFVGSEFPAGS